jgi:hypothetical protein
MFSEIPKAATLRLLHREDYSRCSTKEACKLRLEVIGVEDLLSAPNYRIG